MKSGRSFSVVVLGCVVEVVRAVVMKRFCCRMGASNYCSNGSVLVTKQGLGSPVKCLFTSVNFFAFYCSLQAKEVLILCSSCLSSNIVTLLIQKPCHCARILLTLLKIKILSYFFLNWLAYFFVFCYFILEF